MNDSKTYLGTCHCGKVTFEVQLDLTAASDCNCSLCRRKGAIWHPAPESALRVLSGEDNLHLYQFGTMTAKHYSCSHCGISTFTRPRIDPTRWGVNLRCIDAVDLSALKIRHFNGEQWEESVAAMRAQARPA